MKKKYLPIITSFILLQFPNLTFGQAPTLGAASDFALFTAIGGFDNIGAATHVTGDVGTNVGAFNAFPPGTLVGAKHVVDVVSAQAATDVDVAYSYLAGMTCGPVIGVTLGNGQILTPDVYCIGAASTLNGNLILDGQGDPNSLFIIKINGALATSTFATVTLIDSASFCNVYWQINGAFTLGDSSVFRGTVLVNGAIHLLEGSTLLGQGLSRGGAIDLHNNLVAIGMEPIATITPGGNTTFCAGGSVALTASVTNGIGPFTYSWNPGGQTTSAITVSPTATTTYVVSVTALNGCSENKDAIVITINPLPLVAANASATTICTGSSVTLSGGGAVTYVWTAGINDGIGFVPSSTNTYTVTGTDANNCSNTASTTIHLDALTVVTANATATTLCMGSSVTLTGGGATSYVWTGGVTNGIGFVPSSTNTYTVTGAIGNCSDSDTITITVLPLPTVNLGNDATVTLPCAGYVTLDAGVSGTIYYWNTGATTQTINVAVTGTYYVDITNSNGCMDSDTINLSIYGTFPLNLGPDITVCGCIQLNAYISGATSYQWCNGGTYPYLNVCTTGVYCVTVSNGMCIVTDTINITVVPKPSVVLGNDTTAVTNLLLDAGNAGAMFLWNTGETTQMINVTASGLYIVTATDVNGCSDSDTINVSVLSGIAEIIHADFHVNAYPNPSNNGSFTLSFEIAERGNVEICILSTLGVVVYSEKLENFQGEYQRKITSENFASGIYVADILKGNMRSTVKIVLE